MSVVEPTRGLELTGALDESAADLGWPTRLHEWTTTVDHKKIGIMYVLMSIVFLVIGGFEALLMRWQLFFPRNDVLGHDAFNQLFTMHGTTMVFFVGMPILIGIGNYLVPLMIGARDMAFPRLNAFGVLGHAVRRAAGLLQLHHRRRTRHRLVRLRPADGEHIFAQCRDRLLGARSDRQRHRHDRRRRELHRHDPRHAGAGHDACARCRSSSGRCSGPRSRCCWRSRR